MEPISRGRQYGQGVRFIGFFIIFAINCNPMI